jgi:hypothetical protein
VWGYDAEFMALMPAALGVAGEDITAGDVCVATGTDGQIAGVVALARHRTAVPKRSRRVLRIF